MDHHKKGGGGGSGSGSSSSSSQDVEVRKGPWTMEEDLILINYIATHGEGVWNSLAKAAGLKRTGKSCRLRWLNYLRPDVRRGNITPEEQLLIMELHSKWGNRWSKIAKHLPGRTDNEIKNFWRTRIQKQLKHSTNNTMLNRTLNICNPGDHHTTMDNNNNNNTIDHHHYGQHQQQTSHDHNKAPTSTSQMSTSAASSTCCISGAHNGPDSYSVSSYSHDQPMEGYPMVTGLTGNPTSGNGFYTSGGYLYNGFPSGSSSSSMAAPAVNFGNNCPTGVEGNDNFWNMEELWSMQFFNGD